MIMMTMMMNDDGSTEIPYAHLYPYPVPPSHHERTWLQHACQDSINPVPRYLPTFLSHGVFFSHVFIKDRYLDNSVFECGRGKKDMYFRVGGFFSRGADRPCVSFLLMGWLL